MMFTLTQFDQHGHQVALVFPEESHAAAIFAQVKKNRDLLTRWMPWTKDTKHVHDEENFLRYARTQMISNKLFLLIITVDGTPAGMIDLHDFDQMDHHASVGYWLGTDYQGLGIMTRGLSTLFAVGFNRLGLRKIQVLADVENKKSRAVPERLFCHLDGILPDHIYQSDAYHDAALYSLTLPNYQQLIKEEKLRPVDNMEVNSEL
jgi:ribosomal-protein-serine acetyltransferase